MKKQFYFFHGDVDFFKVDVLPKRFSTFNKTKQHVTQEGTATGHRHLVTSEHEFEVYIADDGKLAYVLTHPAQISHEEHRTHDIEPGTYLVEHEQEEDPREGVVREVID